MIIKYEEALAMALEIGTKAYEPQFIGEKGEALRRAGVTPLSMGLTKVAEGYGLSTTTPFPTFSHWTSAILEVRKGEPTVIQTTITENGATVVMNPEYDRNSEQLQSIEMTEDGETELEAIAKVGLRVLLKMAHRIEAAKLTIAQVIPEGGKL